MVRLIGACIIIFACGGIGFSKSAKLQSHLNDLEEVKKIIHFIGSEINYTRAPFSDVFEKVSKKIKNPYQMWLEKLCNKLNDRTSNSFWSIWKESIDENLKDTYLKQEDLEELKTFGKNLEYAEGLKLYLEQLDYKIKNIREEYTAKQKLYRSLGIMGGVFLVILLL